MAGADGMSVARSSGAVWEVEQCFPAVCLARESNGGYCIHMKEPASNVGSF